jgi:metallo-beta-lactamase family protein
VLRLTFLGATTTVTGSRYLLETAQGRVLIDCGLFQGFKQLRLRNRQPLPVDPKTIDAVLLTHAHLDHSGYLPRLVLDGFRGPIWCSAATNELCQILLPDSGSLQEEEAEYATRHGFSKHRQPQPLYTEADARHALRQFRSVAFETDFTPIAGLTARLRPQGHLLGAAQMHIACAECRITFSGDIGRPHDALMREPSAIAESDWIVTESTYGDRTHASEDSEQQLGDVIRRVVARGGTVVVPAFAVGRAQLLLHYIARLKDDNAIPAVPVYLNSPMAVDATALYQRFRGEHRLSELECNALCKVAKFVNSVEESKALNAQRGPKVIISASGMATGGRVLHHLKAFAPDERNAIVFTGYQAGGTRGAALVAGARTIRIHGADVPVRAEIVQLTTASAHADSNEILDWLQTAPHAPRGVFITHGEANAADVLRQRIERELHWHAHVPEYGEQVDLLAEQRDK